MHQPPTRRPWYSVVQCGPVWSSVVQCGPVWSSGVQRVAYVVVYSGLIDDYQVVRGWFDSSLLEDVVQGACAQTHIAADGCLGY